MPKVIYKNKEGALHIGGGRFFFANESVEVTEEEKEKLLETYEDLEEFVEETLPAGQSTQPDLHTKASLKKLNKEQQEALIIQFEGDVSAAKNEEERIALIMELQEKKDDE
jgi:hypothetical protein